MNLRRGHPCVAVLQYGPFSYEFDMRYFQDRIYIPKPVGFAELFHPVQEYPSIKPLPKLEFVFRRVLDPYIPEVLFEFTKEC